MEGFLEGKANNVICLDLRNIDGAVSDYFIVAHGDSATHVEGINRAIYKNASALLMKNHGERKVKKLRMDSYGLCECSCSYFLQRKELLHIKIYGESSREEFNTD